MTRTHNANDLLLEYRRCQSRYDRLYQKMVAAIRARFAEKVDAAVDESLEAHLRTYVINDLLRALNWNMGVSADHGLPNLVPEAPLWSPGTRTQRFLDYLGVERGDCERPLLIVETKRPSVALPQMQGRRRELEYAEVISRGLQGSKLAGDWSTWLDDLRDYVRAVFANTGSMPKKVVITNGKWIVVFSDPQDAFGASGTNAASKILVFEDEAAVDQDYPLLFEQLEYSRLSNVRDPIEVAEVGFCVRRGAVSKVLRGIQLLYIETPSMYEPPSPFIRIVPLLFLGSSTGEWVCVKGPDEITMPSRPDHLAHHLDEVQQASEAMFADCAARLGGLPQPSTLDSHFAGGLELLPGVREVRRDMYFVLTGDAAHYFRQQPSVPDCRWHDWKFAKTDGFEASPQITDRSVDPRAFFYSGESQHCAHRNVVQIKRSEITAENRPDCGPRSGRDGEAFCEIYRFDTRLCCRACAFETACSRSKLFALPCASTTVGPASAGDTRGTAGQTKAPLIQLRSRSELPQARRARLMADPTNRGLLEIAMRALIDEQRLLKPADLWGTRNENELRVADLTNASIFAQWHGAEFLQAQPEALAYAADPDAERIVEWADRTLDCIVAADIERPNSTWSVAELSLRCSLPEAHVAVGLLFLRFVVTGCNPVDMTTTGLPTAAQLMRSVRTAPSVSLRERVDRERASTN